MANIMVVLHGMGFADLCQMEPHELMRWHGLARERQEK